MSNRRREGGRDSVCARVIEVEKRKYRDRVLNHDLITDRDESNRIF